ncbi:hypothetical protein [Sediminimonas qiaohouensis]|uniref:hypothetical protein n=1 Tax=Sediminimonas qiaohouensis TaxID=552061 RepID=UPI0012ECD4AE|nr:hypothetical protein [Sediminimonas qiaohouensis]
MTTFEVYLSIGSVTGAIAVSFYVRHVVRTAGRDRPRNPEALRRFVEKAEQFSTVRDALRDEGATRTERSQE